MPEIRRASQHFDSSTVQFGTLDCTLHSELCTSEGIRSYPTLMLINGSNVIYFHGVPNEQGLVSFIEDTLNPSGKLSQAKIKLSTFAVSWCCNI